MPSRAGYIVVGSAVLVVSLVATWFVTNRLSDASTSSLPIIPSTKSPGPRQLPPAGGPAVTLETSQTDLPTLAEPAIAWTGIGGLNAQVVNGMPAIAGQAILRLIAVPTVGSHSVAVRLTALEKRMYRIAAWVKPSAGADFAIGAYDPGASEVNSGVGVFDLVDRKVVSRTTTWAGIRQDSEDWLKVWVELPTSTGQLFVNFYVCIRDANPFTFEGDGIRAVTLGGIAAEPLTTFTVYNVVFAAAIIVLVFWAAWLVMDRWLEPSTPSSPVAAGTVTSASKRVPTQASGLAEPPG